MASARALRPVKSDDVWLFKIRNRRGYAAVCLGNLTEGRTAAQAFTRLKYPLRRLGRELPARMPALCKC